MTSLIDRRTDVFFTFGDLADYIYKLPRFFEPEIESERQKLWDYFPKSDDPKTEQRNAPLRRFRFEREFGNLLIRFPRFMAAANLMLACSVFEHKLLMICRSLPQFSNYAASGSRKGVSKLFDFLGELDFDLNDVEMQEQVQVAILFRNCLVHANGLLALSKQERQIRTVCASLRFVEKERRRTYDHAGEFWRAKIEKSEGGDTLVTSNNYAFICCAHFRDFLLDILTRVGG